MSKDLTTSDIERQNILNNPYALAEIERATEIKAIEFKGKRILLKEQVASFFEVAPRTIDRYIESHSKELRENGYEVLRGKTLQDLKLLLKSLDDDDINVVTIKKTSIIGVFDFRAFLDLAMLITESERARLLRSAILDIVIDTINRRTGGGTKYINQRDEDFIHSSFLEENYRKEFADALREHVEMGNFKYPLYTDKIYVSIFRENAQEYRKILRLQERDKIRDTFYSEVLDLISSYEYGFAKALEARAVKLGKKLNNWETDALFKEFEAQPLWKPLVERARMKMSSRDLAFRDALHLQLKEYITPLKAEEFERFLGDKSKELAERMEEAKEVFKRLKERD